MYTTVRLWNPVGGRVGWRTKLRGSRRGGLDEITKHAIARQGELPPGGEVPVECHLLYRSALPVDLIDLGIGGNERRLRGG